MISFSFSTLIKHKNEITDLDKLDLSNDTRSIQLLWSVLVIEKSIVYKKMCFVNGMAIILSLIWSFSFCLVSAFILSKLSNT